MQPSIVNPYAYRSEGAASALPACSPRKLNYCRLIIVIPVLCVIFLVMGHYIHNKDDVLPISGKQANLRNSKAAVGTREVPVEFQSTQIPQENEANFATVIPTITPTAVPTFATAKPSPAPTPTIKPTFAVTAAATIAASQVVAITPPKELIVPTAAPTAPRPTTEPTAVPTVDSRNKVVWLLADSGVSYTQPLDSPLPIVSSAITCWSSASHLDRQSEDFLQSVLYHKTGTPEASQLATPIPFNERLRYLPASFCGGETPAAVTAHSIFDSALPSAVMTLPIDYSWKMMPQETVDETTIAFHTFFFVFYINSAAFDAPSESHHICYFVDHRPSQIPMKLCFLDKQLSLQTAGVDYILATVPIDSSNVDNYVVVSYRISADLSANKLDSVEMYVTGIDDHKYTPVLPTASNNAKDNARGIEPAGNTLEFICTDNSKYCSSRLLVAEAILLEEKLVDDKAQAIIHYLEEKYKLPATLQQPLSQELLTEIATTLGHDLATKPPIIIETIKPKLSCDKGDPFGDSPVDSFIAPENASEEDKKKWKFAIAKMMSDIASVNVGGAVLRGIIDEKVKGLRELRLEIFCRYL